jgi:clan AA aspartic protease
MGLVHAEIELLNSRDIDNFEEGNLPEEKVRRMKVRMNVDSSAIMLAINENIRTQLGLRVVDTRPCLLANGTYDELGVVRNVMVRFKNREAVVSALVLPGDTEPLLGAIPMEEMDVLISPKMQELIVNPAHPNEPVMALR